MKKLIFILLFLSSQLFSQTVKTSKDFDIEIGTAFPVVDAPIKEYFYFNDEILSIKIGDEITVQKFNANSLDQKSRKEIANKKTLPRGFEHEEFVQVNGKVFEFYNVWDKPNETEQIFVQEISFGKMDLENNRRISKISGKVQSSMGKDKIDIYDSFDQSKFLMTYRRHPKVKSDKVNKDVIGMTVFDGDLKVIWEKEITMPYTEAMMDNLGYTVDSRGNAYLLARVRTGEKSHLELLQYNNSDEPKITEINAGGRYFPHGITLKEGKNGIIYCAGFYGEGRSANGVYVSVINARGEIENEQFHDIPLDIINQNVSERKQEKNEKKEDKGKEVGIYELGLDDIIVNEDGSFNLLGEVFYVKTTTTYSSKGGSRTTYTYNYLEMFMTKLTADGKISWMKKLPKSQKYVTSSSSMGFGMSFTSSLKRSGLDLSYRYMSTGKDHYLLYLDNIKNINLPLNKYPETHMSGKGGFLTAYKINDASGDVSKLSLFDLKDVKGIPVFQFTTSRIIQPSDKEIILELYKKQKQDILLRINLK
ncbi:MAG: hypothetical protein COX70_04200 [Flavobacteriales bacterium CG_4_10_14_0_2_um_filter_32_8]|nr:MAG: hypothetical protein COX70_04200 [Flavobacteriales bacterium CG_4_10_14_0_2_um_filter_32_8]